MLEVKTVSKSFRGLRAVRDASFTVPEGGINGLIGPNGAGKTTIFNIVAGVYAPDSGEIYFNGKPIHGLRPHLPDREALRRAFRARQRHRRSLAPGAWRRLGPRPRGLHPGEAQARPQARPAGVLAHPARPQAPRGGARPRHTAAPSAPP